MLTFGSPAFLWALAALAAPVIVHLINRERAVMLKFPSIRYIDASRLPQQGRRRLRDYLLLLLRLLVYAAVVLALANPRWVENAQAAAGADEAPVAVFVVDASASMGHRASSNQIDEALRQYIDGLPSDTRIGLVVYDDQLRASLPPTSDHDAVMQTWSDATKPYNRAGKPAVGLTEAAELLGDRAGELYVFSDFQASDWQNAPAPALPSGAKLEFVSVRPDPWRNVSLQWAKAYPKRDGAVKIFARVRNDNDEPTPIVLELEEPNISTEAEIPPRTSELVTLTIPAEQAPAEPRAGELHVRVDTEESWPESNLYQVDDRYHFWLGKPQATVVGAMVPMEEEPAKMREASFVARALEVGDESTAGQFDFMALTPENQNWQDEVDALYLPGTGAYFDQEAWAQIREFVESGHVLFVTPSKAAPRLFRGLRESGLANTAYVGKPRRARDANTIYRIGELPDNGSLAQVFEEDAREDLYLTDIYEHWLLRPGAGAEVLLKTESGDPLLIRERVGNGAVIISALDFDPDYTDLPLRNSFVPLLWETLGESVDANRANPSLEVGEDIPAELTPEGMGGEFDTSQPGVILVNGAPVEINVARSESIAQGAVLADLRGRVMAGARGPAAETSGAGEEPGEPLWPWLGALALLACLIESALASRIDQPTEAAA